MNYNFKDERIFNQEVPYGINYPNVPVGALLKGSARKYKDRASFIYEDYSISFEELYKESLCFANALNGLGIGKGKVVATHLPTCPQYIIAYYGILLSGATYSPINPALPVDDLINQLNDCGAQVIITYDLWAQTIRQVFKNTNLEIGIVTGNSELYLKENVDTSSYGDNWYSFASLVLRGAADEIEAGIDPQNDIAHIAYTGGTTGRPKGVMLTHSNVIANTSQNAAWCFGCFPVLDEYGGLVMEPIEKDQATYLTKYKSLPGTGISLSPSPIFHGAGVIGRVITPVSMGNTGILFDRFDPGKFLADIEKYQVTQIGGAPTMWNYLLLHPAIKKHDFSTVKEVSSGAAPLAMEQMKLLIETFPNAVVTEGYGLTEATASVANSVSILSGLRKLGTVGHPTYDTEVKVIDVDGSSEEPLPVGALGEVCVRGPQIMKGYMNKPEETAEALKDGWLHTGDIGQFDEDGLLSIVDRKKDMLIYKGYNVYPSRLEELLFEHPAVANAIVIGKPGAELGEIPKAFVILKPGVSVKTEDLIEFVNCRVVHYSKIRELEFVTEFPVTAAGKISKVALRNMEMEKSK